MNKIAKKAIELIPWMVTVAFILVLPLIWADTKLAGTSLPRFWPDNALMLDASLLPRQLLLAIYLLAILPIFAIYIFKGSRISFNRSEKVIFGGLALFMLMHIVSCVNVTNHHEAFFHMIKEFMFCLWFFSIYQMLRQNPNGREWLIKTITAMSTVFIAIAIVQLANSDFSQYRMATNHRSYYLNQIMEKTFSTCSNKNLLASLLFITLPTTIYNIANFKKHNVWSAIWLGIGGATALANLTLIVLLLTRTVFAAVALSGFVAIITIYIYILVLRPRLTGVTVGKKTRIAMIAAPVVAVIAFTTIICVTETQIEKTIKERIGVTFNPEEYGYRNNDNGESSVAMRKIIWGKTLEMIKEHPLIGSGPGQWQINIPKFGVDEFGEKMRGGTLTFQRPHNDYLWFASEVGLTGLFGYLVFYIGIIAIGFINIRQTRNRSTLVFNILAVSVLIGWMLVSMLDYPHERIEHNIALLAICAIVLADHPKAETEGNEQSGKTISFCLLAIASAITISGFTQTLQFCKGEHNAREIHSYFYGQGWKKVLHLTRKANRQPYTINNYSAPILYYKGFALSMTGNNQDAIIELKNALKYAPYHILTINTCGMVYMKLEQYDEAEKMYMRTLKISPRNHNALYDMAIMHYNQKKFHQAFKYISQIPLDIKSKPSNFENVYLTICRYAVNENKDLYNAANLNAWMNNDKRIFATIKKFQADTCSFSKILMDEVGAAN
ncbi:MAG: O-antigen ligase family protein [Salinivirgaceae bacterium]|nr:O-antigen ligase family protein [Salinivirgaceae bacterium]